MTVRHAVLALLAFGCHTAAPAPAPASAPARLDGPGLGEPVRLGPAIAIHVRRAIGLAVDPTGTTMVSAADVREDFERAEGQPTEPGVQVWDVATARRRARLGEREVAAMAATPDARVVAAMDPHGDVELWTVATRTRRGQLALGPGILWIGLDATGDAVFAVARDGRVQRWQLGGTRPHELRLGATLRAAAGPADGRIVVGDDRGQLAVVDVAGGAIDRVASGLMRVDAVTISRDGTRIAAIDDQRGGVWEHGRLVAQLPLGGQLVRLLADGQHALVSGPSQQSSLARVTLATGEVEVLDEGGGHALAIAELPGDRIAAGTWDGPIRIYDLAHHRDTQAASGHTTWIQLLGFTADGGVLASSGQFVADRTLVWPRLDGAPRDQPRVIALSPAGGVRAELDGDTLRAAGHGWPSEYTPQHVAISRDERWMVTMDSHDDSGVEVTSYDLATGATATWQLPAPAFGQQLAVADDGAVVAVGGSATALYDRATGRLIRRLRNDTLNVAALEFTRHDALLLSASESDGLQIWNVASGVARTLYPGERGKPQGTGNTAYSLAVSPDGALVASGHRDGTVQLWDVDTGRPLATRAQHRGLVNRAAFSLDGRSLVTGDRHGQIYVWPVR